MHCKNCNRKITKKNFDIGECFSCQLKCVVCGSKLQNLYAKYCNKCKLAGDKCHKWKGGKPKCVDCGKQLARYKATRCRKCRGLWMRAGNNWNLGKRTEAQNAHLMLYKQIRDCSTYKDWRIMVFARDGWTCVWCGDSRGGNLNANHIIRFIDILRKCSISSYEDAIACVELWDTQNGITLCEPCHRKTYAKEEMFVDIFREMIK